MKLTEALKLFEATATPKHIILNLKELSGILRKPDWKRIEEALSMLEKNNRKDLKIFDDTLADLLDEIAGPLSVPSDVRDRIAKFAKKTGGLK